MRTADQARDKMQIFSLFHAMLVSCWSVDFSHFITELKIYQLCSIWQCWSSQFAGRLSHINSIKWPCCPWVLVAQWIERLPGVQEVVGLSPVKDSDFSLFYTRFMLISSLFTGIFTLNVRFQGKHLVLFSKESWCFPRRSQGKHQD